MKKYFMIVIFFASVLVMADVPNSEKDIRPLLPGSLMPKVALKDSNNATFDLNKAISQNPHIIIFYRGSW